MSIEKCNKCISRSNNTIIFKRFLLHLDSSNLKERGSARDGGEVCLLIGCLKMEEKRELKAAQPNVCCFFSLTFYP